MNRPILTLCVVTTLALLLAAPVRGSIPDPGECTVPPRIVSCPAGDDSFVVITRRADAGLWCDGPVNVHLGSCPGYRLSAVGNHPYTVDAAGTASIGPCNYGTASAFPFAGGGVCPGDSVLVDVVGIYLRYVTVASFDQNGDLMVDHTDAAIVESKLGTADPTADFDGDGIVTSMDLALLQQHLGHHAPDATTGVPGQPLASVLLSVPMPNPFRQRTRFAITLANAARVDVALFDAGGRRVATVFSGTMAAGVHPLDWGGHGSDGAALSNGIYFLNAIAGSTHMLRRTVFLGGR